MSDSELLSPAGKADVIAGYLRARPDVRVAVETGLWEGWGSLMRLPADALAQLELCAVIDAQAENIRRAEREAPEPARRWTFVLGDSGELLPVVLPLWPEPVLFWLDAHWFCSGDPEPASSPLERELPAAIAHHERSGRDVILIDDVRAMGEIPGMPPLAWVREQLEAAGLTVTVESDILRAC